MSKKLGKKKKDSMSKMLDADANLDKKSYELGLAHGHSRALYLIKLCLDGYKEAAADPSAMKEHFPDDDDITLDNYIKKQLKTLLFDEKHFSKVRI